MIPWRRSVGAWVGSVAHRLALGARSDAARQRRREIPITSLIASNAADGPRAVPAGCRTSIITGSTLRSRSNEET